MEKVMSLCKAGAKIVDICQAGDDFITAECKKAFPKEQIDRGIAFPTSVAVNNIAGHFSPLKDDKATLAKNNVVKIDLGAHIDGYLALAARTMVVEPSGDVTGKVADVITAAQVAMNAAVHMLQIGKTVCYPFDISFDDFERLLALPVDTPEQIKTFPVIPTARQGRKICSHIFSTSLPLFCFLS